MTTIPQILFQQAARRPEALAIKDGDWELTYGQLARNVETAAEVMNAMGLGQGDKFGIWAPNCAEWIITALAGQALGAVMVTLNTRYKGTEAADILRRSHCKYLFTVKGFLGHDYPAMLGGEDLPDLQDIIITCLIKGAAIFPLAVFDPKDVLARIQRDKITVMPGAPTIFQTLLSHPDLSKHDISSLRVATTGATTIPVDLIRRMHEELGIDDVFSAYGLTESTGVVSLCQKGDDFKTIATTCGRPLPGTELRIVNDVGQDVPREEEGEIWVRGFHVMQGYLDDEIATAQAITNEGWLKTGDIGIQDAEGYIKVTDRKKDMVIVGGFNVYPAEVEKALLQHPQISDVAVTGAPDERLGEVTHAHIVTAANVSEKDIMTWSREHMANYKVPRHISFHASLPRNASGKVQKYLLKA